MKRRIRRQIRAKLLAMPAEAAAAKSRAACGRLVETQPYKQADTVMMYIPLPGEVDTIYLALSAWQDDKTVLVPQVDWDHYHMIPVTCRSFEDEMIVSRHGLRTPANGEPWPLEQIDLIIVPALAYDLNGHRVGHGGGFYDRFLQQPQVHGASCGLGFEEQLVDELPVHDHDQRLDMLVTDARILTFK